MKKLLIFFLIVAQQCLATNHTVTSPGNGSDIRANTVTALSGLTDGDTLTFPTCSCYVSHPTISITVKIKILGTDTSNTILYRHTTSTDANLLNVPFFTFTGTSWNMVPSGVKIKGIKFKSKTPSVDDAGADGNSIALDQALKFTNVPVFEVDQCSFWYFGNGAVYVEHRDYFARGLIHKNNFINNAKGASGLGYGYGVVIYGENLQWMSYANHTDGNMIYIEDNIFKMQSHAIAAGGCAKYESRYNKIYNNIVADNTSKHAIDGHGQQGNGGALGSQNYYSTRLMISYYDTVINNLFFDRTAYISNGTTTLSRPMERLIDSRGAQMFVHNDYLYGGRFGVTIQSDGGAWSYPYLFGQGYGSGLTYPSTHTGTSVSQGEGDCYVWSNNYSVYDGSNGDGTGFYNYETSNFTVDRDYHYSTNGTAAPSNWADLIYPCIYNY